MRTGLTGTAKSWLYFVSSQLIPMKHVSTVQKDKAMLTYAIVSGFKFNVGAMIENHILESFIGWSLYIHPSLPSFVCKLGWKLPKMKKNAPHDPSSIPLEEYLSFKTQY